MLRENDGDSFPGATHYAFAPVSSGECCLLQSVDALSAALSAAGHSYTFRGGRLFFEISDEDLEDLCKGPEPNPTGMDNTDLEDGTPRQVTGTDFGPSEGELWLGNAATWAGSGVKVEQTVDVWTATQIDFTVVQGALPESPPAAYLYVFNACVRANAVGFEVAIVVV